MPRKRDPKDKPQHDNNIEPSKREKHEQGQRRKAMGKDKEKQRKKPDWFQR